MVMCAAAQTMMVSGRLEPACYHAWAGSTKARSGTPPSLSCSMGTWARAGCILGSEADLEAINGADIHQLAGLLA